jgi:hypothetical protein
MQAIQKAFAAFKTLEAARRRAEGQVAVPTAAEISEVLLGTFAVQV